MRKLYLLFIWFVVAGALASCDKEDNPNPITTPVQDYLPTANGSTWSYGGIAPYTLSVTGETKVLNGKNYHELQWQQGLTAYNVYVAKEEDVYTAIGLVSGMGNLEIAILKENTPVGGSWKQTGSFNGIDYNMLLTIVEKAPTKTIGNKTYDNVVNVKIETSYSYAGLYSATKFTTNYYFAKGVGIILTDFGANGQAPLLTYEVK